MKRSIFPKMALLGIGKNRKIYLPYIFSCTGTVMMSFILQVISISPSVRGMKGGDNIGAVLSMGKFVVAVFALLFLTYTNSFLVKRRNKEFGLYSVLGVDKKGLIRIVSWESLTVYAVSLLGGLTLGTLFSKLAELGFLYFAGGKADYSPPNLIKSILVTVGIFSLIFLFLYLKNVIRLLRSDPLELMKSGSIGERPPKTNRLAAAAGAILLAVAYGMAVSIQNPISAIFAFLIAVVLVILATYLLFISGSCALCNLLKNNKKYYYKKNHFVSVSSMAYRMKRNGAGLASICILSTMVLVMLASSASLYFGREESLRTRYPRENELDVHLSLSRAYDGQTTKRLQSECEKVFTQFGVQPENLREYVYSEITGLPEDDSVKLDPGFDFSALSFERVRSFYFITEEEYERLSGESLSLGENETVIQCLRCKYDKSLLRFGSLTLSVVGTVDKAPQIGEAYANMIPSIIAVVKDGSVLSSLEQLKDVAGDSMLTTTYSYSYDLSCEDEVKKEVLHGQHEALNEIPFFRQENISYSSDSVTEYREEFYTTYGGLFFLGILLSILFIFAQTTMIYYKQISEGYEDRDRFTIMKKVGMTDTDIKESINSQVLTVFFAPLVMSGIHFSFAFVPIWKILQLFNLRNLAFVILISAVAFVLFGVCYAVIYKITAGEYYKIVRNKESA